MRNRKPMKSITGFSSMTFVTGSGGVALDEALGRFVRENLQDGRDIAFDAVDVEYEDDYKSSGKAPSSFDS